MQYRTKLPVLFARCLALWAPRVEVPAWVFLREALACYFSCAPYCPPHTPIFFNLYLLFRVVVSPFITGARSRRHYKARVVRSTSHLCLDHAPGGSSSHKHRLQLHVPQNCHYYSKLLKHH